MEITVLTPDHGWWLQLNATLICDLLARAVSNREGTLELPGETDTGPEVLQAVEFLEEQGWFEKGDGVGTWTATPAGCFWFESLDYGDIVAFYEYGGAVFLLNTSLSGNETIVWHRGRFATISIAYLPHPEHFEVRMENEPVTTSGGFHMQDALAAACTLLAKDLDVPRPQKPQELRLHMLNYLEQLETAIRYGI